MNYRRSKLNEGMRAGDLKNIVLPLISVDEYESKVDESAIVVGFYVHDADAADDLNRFLQKSATPILDSEVSPAPDQHGYFLCFVEFLDNKVFATHLESILEEVSLLTSIEDWQMRVRHHDEVEDFSKEKVVKLIQQAREPKKSSVMEYLTASDLKNLTLDEGVLVMEGYRDNETFRFVDIGPTSSITSEHKLTESRYNLAFVDVAYCGKIASMLGGGWHVSLIENRLLIQNASNDISLLLEKTP